MSENNESDNFVKQRITAFLLDKPIWVWWIFHVIVTGALFGIFSLAFYLLGIQWWIGVPILLVTGIVWGSVMYNRMKGKIKAEKTGEGQPV